MDKFLKFTGRIDRRSPRDEGEDNDPITRENLLSRDGRLTQPRGTETLLSSITDIMTWMGRYHTIETGIVSPKTFGYTKDGKLWAINESAGTATLLRSDLKIDAYPKSWLIKSAEQTYLYMVDGDKLWKYDGNNDNLFVDTEVVDADGNSIKPIDLIEHRDRLCLISELYVFISKNLDFDVFDDATDSFQGITGSGKGRNIFIGKIENFLFVFNTEGIFGLSGDVISAVASTFEIRLVEERNIIAGGSAQKVEKSIIFLAAQDKNIELWSFDGSNSKLLSYKEKLNDFIHPYPEMLKKACSCYFNNYYMLSVVETGMTYNNLEFWYDTLEDKIEFVRGRNVSSYMVTDPTVESCFQLLGRSDANKIMWAERGLNFDGIGIAKRLRSRDIVVNGENVRFTAFYSKIEPTGEREIMFSYLLDGRLSDLDGLANFEQDLSGEAKFLGLIRIVNQGQFIDRVRPRINYARGVSIAFEIYNATANLDFRCSGIGFDYISRKDKKSKKVGA